MSMLFQKETLDYVFDDLRDIGFLSVQETKLDRFMPKLQLDYDQYKRLEDSGLLHIYTVRNFEEIVGFSVYFVVNSMFEKDCLQAENHVVFVLPQYRSNSTAQGLFSFAENDLKSLGVRFVVQKSSKEKDISKLCKRLGYTHIEEVYSKIL